MNLEALKYYAKKDCRFDYSKFYDFIASYKNFKTFVEIGVLKGRAISYLAAKLKNRTGIKLYAVDVFETIHTLSHDHLKGYQSQKGYLYEMYNYNLQEAGVRSLIEDKIGLSWEVAKDFRDDYFDFIFIDADHTYEGVRKDIEAWYPKLKKGGIISGHDYHSSWPGTIKAVDEFFDKKIKRMCRSVWYVKYDF
jgi:hypothetical protein